jgi:hypothetical protein
MWSDRPLFWDRQGRPIDVMNFARKHDDLDYHFVAEHYVRGWQVTTIWLGLDGNLNPFAKVPPLIFETMIFPPGDVTISGGGELDDYQDRYATEAAAQAGHDRALAWVVEKLGLDSSADITGPLVPGTGNDSADWDAGGMP